jgi:hypothetical protein
MAGEFVAVGDFNMIFMLTIIFFIVMGMSVFLLVITYAFTPAAIFLKAKFGRKDVLMTINRARKAVFQTVKLSSGLLSTKEEESFITDPEGVTNEQKSGVRLFFADPEIGITLPPKIVKIIQGLQNIKIPNIEVAEKVNHLYRKCMAAGCGFLDICEYDFEHDGQGNITKETYTCPKCGGHDLQPMELKVPIIPTETLKFKDLIMFMRNNFNANLIHSTIERRVAEEIANMKAPPIKWIVMGLGILFIFIGLGIFLQIGLPMLTGAGGAAAPAAAANAAATVATNTTHVVV